MQLPYFLSDRFVLFALTAGSILVYAVTPDWVFSEWWPNFFLDFMGNFFPPIKNYTQKSRFPEATSIYMSLMFLLTPVHAAKTFKELKGNKSAAWYKNLWYIESNIELVRRILILSLLAAMLIFAFFINPGYDFNLLPINSSKTALALGGWIVCGGIQGATIGYIYSNLLAINLYLNG